MISSTSSSDRSLPIEPLPTATAVPVVRPESPRTDTVSASSAEYLAAALSRSPALRPATVERARALANDPSYPPFDIMKKVAEKILSAPDLSEDQS
jgi:hypothetical protein